MGALIEARSAERFRLLAPHLPAPLGRLYADLGACEARHFELYVGFARAAAATEWPARLAELAACEAQLVTTPEDVLRFHSGPLRRGAAGATVAYKLGPGRGHLRHQTGLSVVCCPGILTDQDSETP